MGWAHGQFYTIFVDNRTWPKPGKLLGYDGIKLDVTSNSVSKKDIVDEFWKGEQRWAAGIYMSRSSTHQIRLLVGLVVNKQLLNCHQVSKDNSVSETPVYGCGGFEWSDLYPALQEMGQRKMDGSWIIQVSVIFLEHRAHIKILHLTGEREYLPWVKPLSCLLLKYF